MRKTLIALALAAVTALCVGGMKPAYAAEFNQQAELEKFWKMPDDTVVGKVNGKSVTKGELMKTLWFWNGPTVLTEMLTRTMIDDAAEKAGVTLDYGKDVQPKIDETLAKAKMTDLDSFCATYKITKNRFLAGTKMSVLADKVARKQFAVTDDQLAQYVKASHILVKFDSAEKDKDKADADAKAKIDGIYAKVKAGENFAVLATQNSDDPGSAKNGGSLGWFTHGEMVPEFEKTAFELKVGEYSEPFKTQYGYHIVKLDAIGKDATPAEKEQLRNQVAERSMYLQQWLMGVQSAADMQNYLAAPVVKKTVPGGDDMPPAPPAN